MIDVFMCDENALELMRVDPVNFQFIRDAFTGNARVHQNAAFIVADQYGIAVGSRGTPSSAMRSLVFS